ncbi:MAG: transposase [Prevotella sp.]|nr:transposase [Prevotella sp.]
MRYKLKSSTKIRNYIRYWNLIQEENKSGTDKMYGSKDGKSRFNRRLHQIGEFLSELFFYTGQAINDMNLKTTYSIDSFPVSVCQNIRIANSRIVKGKEYRGRCVSKRCWFYGFKVHMIVTSGGIPVEFTFTARSKHDLDGIRQLPVNLPEGSEVLACCLYRLPYGRWDLIAC